MCDEHALKWLAIPRQSVPKASMYQQGCWKRDGSFLIWVLVFPECLGLLFPRKVGCGLGFSTRGACCVFVGSHTENFIFLV